MPPPHPAATVAHDHRRTPAPTTAKPATTSPPTSDEQAVLDLQRQAGNDAVTRVIQRWDTSEAEKKNPTGFAGLLAKMQGLTPVIGRSRLEKLAAKTDGPGQLAGFLTKVSVADVERCLNLMDAATLQQFISLAPGPGPFTKAVDEVVRFSIDLKAVLATPATPGAAVNFQTILDSIQTAKSAAGLISAKGTEIVMTTVAGVTGDGLPDEKKAVKDAVASLDAGTLPGTAHNNRDGDLPGVRRAGGYTEHDVAPPPGVTTRGERRLVVHDAKQFVYYTWNHYGKDGTVLPAFKRIR